MWLLEDVTNGNERMKNNYKRECVDLCSTLQRQRGSNGYRVVEDAGGYSGCRIYWD